MRVESVTVYYDDHGQTELDVDVELEGVTGDFRLPFRPSELDGFDAVLGSLREGAEQLVMERVRTWVTE